MQRASIDPDDPRVWAYLPDGKEGKLAKGVLGGMKDWFKEILGNEHPKWAASFATAAVGGFVMPGQGRRPQGRAVDGDRRRYLRKLISARLPEITTAELKELMAPLGTVQPRKAAARYAA